MSDFNTACAGSSTLDPYKRVKYSTGLVLGLDEFLQEELYFLEKNRLHNRALHGYGTVCGLDVSVREGADPTVVVSAGLAVDPKGREIRVSQDQCAQLNDWLARHDDEVAGRFGSPPLLGSPPQLSLYVVLCYRECETDEVPIPSGPCRSLEDSSVPSRIADDFELAIRLDPPAQAEEDSIAALGELLRQIEISDAPGEFLTREGLEDLVRGLLAGSPPVAPESSPPVELRLHPDEAAEFLRGAFRVWVTEVRPHLLPGGRNCASGPPQEDCILLACLGVPVEEIAGRLRVAGEVHIEEEDRPYLLHTRVLQEWLLHNLRTSGVTVHSELGGLAADDHPQYLLVDSATRALIGDLDAAGNRVVGLAPGATPGDAVPFQQAVKVGDAAGGDLGGTYPDPTVTGLQGNPVADAAPQNTEVLTWNGVEWRPAPPAAGVTDHDALNGLGDDDHSQYLLVDPATRALVSDLDAAGNGITNLGEGTNPGDAVPFQQAVKVGDAAGGDLGGDYPNPSVDALQGRPVADLNPGLDEVLTWDGTRWTPRSVPVLERGLNQIVALSWQHGSPSSLQFTLDGNAAFGLVVGFSHGVEVRPGSLDDNTFQLFVEREEQPGLMSRLRVVPISITPVEPGALVGGLITQAKTTSTPAPGAALVIRPEQAKLLVEQKLRLLVVIKGDFILDEKGRAIDAEHLRGELPTGDRPAGEDLGIQGGTFESWIQPEGLGLPRSEVVDINRATATELTTLPGVGPTLAGRIVEARDRLGGFDSVERLREVPGISDVTLNRIRSRLVVG